MYSITVFAELCRKHQYLQYLAHASICTHTHNMHMYTLAGDVYHPQVDGQRKRLMWKEDKVERCERGREDEYMFSSRADG